MNSEKRVAVLVVAFLGVPKTAESLMTNSELRYSYTKEAFLNIQKRFDKDNLFLGLVGDKSECSRFILEFGLDQNNANWFEQDSSLISRGVGALENQLIMNCIKLWSFEEKFDLVLKITGKYEVINLEELIFLCRKTSQPLFAWKFFFKEMVDTRVFLFDPSFYVKSQNHFEMIDASPGFWIENIIYKIMKMNLFKFGKILYRPILMGWAGTTNEFAFTPIHKRMLINLTTKLDMLLFLITQKAKSYFKWI